jgi:hypothetical protein
VSGDVGPGRPPAGSRFRKGESGNPKGRPRSDAGPSPSAFDAVIDVTLTLTQNGKRREFTAEEALQQKTYQAAITGDRAAQREVLKMVAKREKWLAAKPVRRRSIEKLTEPEDPDNANKALILLGVGERDTRGYPVDKYERLLLQPWAVQAALSRRGRRWISDKDVADINRCTRDPETIRWPTSMRE